MEILAADYHRNGIAGEGFYVGIIRDDDLSRKLVITFPDEDGGIYTAVLDLDEAHRGNIYMHPDPDTPETGHNAWRGDHYHDLQDQFRQVVSDRSDRRMTKFLEERKADRGTSD